jgi:predicted ATP-grasp superfamily ATP-dependent carboligase
MGEGNGLRPRRRVGAVVVGGDYQGLGIVRSTGRLGAPVCVIDDERSIARFSRYTSHAVRVEDLRDGERSVESVLATGRRLGLDGWVLFPTRDEIVAAFSQHRDHLLATFRVPTPGWNTIRWAWDKRKTYDLAGRLGISIPQTWYAASGGDPDRIDWQYPVVLKPAIKERFFYATRAKGWLAEDRAQLERRYAEAVELIGRDEVIVQTLIPGGGQSQYAYCAFFKGGSALASMVVRRRRQHPPELGRASTYVETIELPELEELSVRFLRAIDYYGLVELEYKRDERDGEYKLLDVNARTWGYHSLDARAGVDFSAMLLRDQLGEPVERVRARPGIRWMRLVTDLPTAAIEMRRGTLGLRGYLGSIRGVDEEAVFTLRDPLPGLVELALLPYLAIRRGF